ncbi:MAG: hypothetical protein JSU63_02230 [Phycisphaerales bacterium]|nr:MAG: hypothetical protein JSU63_02230 [Phycisphaerales bacterium]
MKAAISNIKCSTLRSILIRYLGALAAGVVFGLVMWPDVPAAAQEPLPDAATVLDRYVQVTGGKAAYERIHNRVSKERVLHVEMDFEDSAVRYAATPNKNYTEIESEAFGAIRHGTDGDTVWYLADTIGPVIQEGAARTSGLHASAFNRAVRWRDLYKKVECVGEEVVEGKTCYKLIMTPHEGQPETRYYDKESGLLVKTATTRLFSGMPPMPMEVTFRDYKEVDGLLIAHESKQSMQQCGGTREMLFTTTSIKHNVDLPADRFNPPKEILALMKPNDTGSGAALAAGGSGCGGGSGCSGGSGCAGGCSGGCGGASASATAAAEKSSGGCGGSGAAPATAKASPSGGCGGSHAATTQESGDQPASRGGCSGG